MANPPFLANCRVVSFDACDTIIAADPPYPDTVHAACRGLGFEVTLETVRAICRSATQVNLQHLVDAWRTGRRLPSGAFFQAWRRAFRQDARWPGLTEQDFDRLTERLVGAFSTMAPLPGATRVLDAVRRSGRRLVVTSNFDDTLTQVLHEAGLAQYFDAIIASEEVDCEKPDTEIFRIALDRVGARPEHAVHVGDSIFDHVGAQDAGMRGVWLRAPDAPTVDGAPPADAEIASLDELLPLLGIDDTEATDGR